MDEGKRCSCCRRMLPRSAFAVRRASPDGLQYMCKECYKKTMTEKRAELARRGICTRCHHRPAEPGRKMCKDCLAFAKRQRILGGRKEKA